MVTELHDAAACAAKIVWMIDSATTWKHGARAVRMPGARADLHVGVIGRERLGPPPEG